MSLFVNASDTKLLNMLKTAVFVIGIRGLGRKTLHAAQLGHGSKKLAKFRRNRAMPSCESRGTNLRQTSRQTRD